MKLSTYIIVVICLCACSGDDGHIEVPADPDAKVQIRPKSNIRTENGKGSRDGGVIEPGTSIDVSVFRTDETYPAGWSGVTADLKASIDADGTVTFGIPQYYSGLKATKLVGIYPAIGSGATWSPTTGTGTVTVPIDGYTDIMATPIVECDREAQPTMQFKHLLTQIEVTVIGEDATAIGLWGTINSVTVTGRANTCAIVLPVPTAANGTAAAAPTFSGSDNLAARTKSGGTVSALTATTGEQTFGYCMFAPVTTNTQLPLTVTTSKGGAINVSVAAQTYAAGMAYKVQLKLTATAIEVETTIAPWQPTVDLYYDIDSPHTNARPESTTIADWSTGGDYDFE